MEPENNEKLLNSQNSRINDLILHHKKNCKMITLQEKLIGKIKNGQIAEALDILNPMDSDFRSEMLEFQDFHFYFRIITFIDYECFSSFLDLLDDEQLEKMVYAKDGQIFKALTYNTCLADNDREDEIEDFIEKAKLFLEFDKKYFQEAFNNTIKELKERGEKTKNAFHSLIEMSEKSIANNISENLEEPSEFDEISRPRKKIHHSSNKKAELKFL